MKINVTKIGFIAAFMLFATAGLHAQTTPVNSVKTFAPEIDYNTWSIGVNLGTLNQSNLIGIRRRFDQVEHRLGYGLYVKKQLLPAFGIQLDYMGGKIAGSYKDNDNSFETKLPWSVALSGQVTLANINWRQHQGLVKPYLAAGLGVLGFEPTTEINGTTTTTESTAKMFIPAGLGLKFAVAPNILLDLGYKMNLVQSGNVDGVRSNKDIFTFTHVGVEFALGDKAKPFLANSNPVSTLYDEILEQKTLINEQNAIIASQESKNAAIRADLDKLNADLADDDGDGVANRFDQCPDTPAGIKVDGAGCPLPEPVEPVIQQIVVTEEDRRVVDEAIQNLEFDLGKATIRGSSNASLNKVAALLIEKNFSLKLAGHTDNTGSMQTNMRLSKERAESVKAYLVSKGANASRIEATGYGPTQPIATNNTDQGRQQNRRVEFTLY